MLYGSDLAMFDGLPVLCFFWRLVTHNLKKRVRLFLGFQVFLGSSKGLYQVIPVTVFLMTLCNACFMFQMDNSINMMIETLQQFDLIPNLDNTSLPGTLSK